MVTKDPCNPTTPGARLRRASGQRSQRPVLSGPVRTCIGCRKEGTPEDLVRMVLAPDGGVAFDLAGGAVGRGAWVHPTEACLQKASKATGRHLGAHAAPTETRNHEASVAGLTAANPDNPADITTNNGTLLRSVQPLLFILAAAAKRRAAGLISAAYRARYVALGSDASRQAFHEGRARLVVLASDALAAGKESWIETATAKGLLAVWSTKAELGALMGRDELAVLTVLDSGLAQSLTRVFAMTIPAASHLAKGTVSTWTTGLPGPQDSEDG
ncbi:MAG TPA: DUF448 domain-containing protein [Polyangiaceae bacterium]